MNETESDCLVLDLSLSNAKRKITRFSIQISTTHINVMRNRTNGPTKNWIILTYTDREENRRNSKQLIGYQAENMFGFFFFSF